MPARKPSKTKKMQGTERPCRANRDEPKPVAGRPDSYLPLEGLAAEMYDRISADVEALGVLATTDGATIYDAAVNLASLAAIRVEIAALEKLEREDTEESARLRNFDARIKLMIREESRSKQHRSYMQTLGLTPVDRARVSVIEKKDKSQSRWAEFMKPDDGERLPLN